MAGILSLTASPSPMIRLAGGGFSMGSDDFYPEEQPARRASLASFELDRHPVTNRQFERFVAETGYVTVAERELPSSDFPQLDDAQRAAGSLVFTPTAGPVDLADWRQWWSWVPGACWRSPYGPHSGIQGKADHPVVQISFEDAASYAAWAGKRLPSETEWEYAARGGLDGAVYAWGNEPQEPGNLMANTWQGNFPYCNTGANGWVGTSPVGSFPANGYGLYDMIGNVWEWTVTPFDSKSPAPCGCSPVADVSSSPDLTLKGGSHLCAPEYCFRYRPAARSAQNRDSATSHIGFRCAR